MRKVLAASFALALVAPLFLAGCGGEEQGDQTQAETQAVQQEQAKPFSYPKAVTVVGSCVAAALVASGCGYAIARIGATCVEAIARQPEAGGSMFAPMVVAAAMVESGMLFAILVCLLGVVSD